MSWSMELLARTSVNTYDEVHKVMRLPHISYVYKKSGEIIASAHQRAFSLSIQKLQSMRLRAKNEDWSDNAKLTVTALDSAGINKGVQ